MARTSKFSVDTVRAQRSWHPALYIRLSREDGDKEESDSIGNQRQLLEDFIAQQDDMELPKLYQDDGYSGTSFQRPGFQQMLQDAEQGIVDCVVVKDLSRLGRNYTEVGQYLEQIFPLLNLRFISVNDGLDSYKKPNEMDTLVVPVKNIINDEYARDISKKVRSSLNLKRKQGQFIGSFASYGYRKDPDQRGKLLVDEEAAQVVRDIYCWFLEGYSILGIAKKLNQMGVPNPTAYKKGQGLGYRHPAGERLDGLWPDSSVRRILKNKLYTGTMVQGKNRIKSYKLHVSETIPQAEWIEVENTHEAIVTPNQYHKVQQLLSRDRRAVPSTQREYLLSGLVRCADCGRAMNRKKIIQPYGEYHYYYCATYKKQGLCTKHSIRSDGLEQAVLGTLQQQIALAVEMDELIASINDTETRNCSSKRLERAISSGEERRIQRERMKLELYPDWKNGDITREEYLALKEKLDEEIAVLDNTLDELKRERADIQRGVDGNNPFLSQFTQYRNLRELSRPIVLELIDMIYVREGGDIEIQFSFSDAFQTAQEFIVANGSGAQEGIL